MMRSTVLAALSVCKVPKTRWPVLAAVMASSIVSRSRISPTRMMSGSSRRAPRRAAAKERGVHAHLAMVHQAVLALVHKLDRVLDGDDVIVPVLVGVVHHRRQGGGLARAGRPGHHHQAAVQHGEFLQHRRQRRVQLLEVFEGQHLGGNLAEDGRDAVLLVEEVGAEARHLRNFVAEIHVPRFLEELDLVLRRDLVEHGLERVALQRRVVHPLQFAVDPQHGRVAGGQMHVRCFLLQHQVEESVNFRHT